MGLHDNVGFPSETAIEAMEVQSRHDELTSWIRLAASVRAGEDFEVLEFDALKHK